MAGAQVAAQEPPVTGVARVVISFCTMTATLMQVLDSTIANVALPYMQGGLSTSRDQITWVLSSYVISMAIMTAPAGWLAARFGRKNVFVVSLAGFTVSSMLCGLSQSLEEMVVFRVLQGSFGGALLPLSQSTMYEIFPVEKRGSAMAIWGMGVMVGPIVGPTLGGFLTEFYDWRWVFFVNVPFGIAAITGLVLFWKGPGRNERLRFDWLGFAVIATAIGALQLMLDRGAGEDWFESNEIIFEAVLAGLGFYLFAVHLATAKQPFLPPRLFLDAGFVSCLAMMFVVGIVLLASSALLPPYLQNLGGHSVLDTGLLMAPRGVGTMLAMLVVGRLSMQVDPRLVIGAGLLLMSFPLLDMAWWTPDVSALRLTTMTFIQGIGMGCVFVPVNLVAFATIAPDLRTDAAAMLALIRNIGMAVGVSVSSTILGSSVQALHAQLAEHVSPFNRMLQSGTAALFWNPATPYGLAGIDQEVQRQALIIAYSNDFLFMFFISVPTVLLLLFMRRPALAALPEPEDSAAH